MYVAYCYFGVVNANICPFFRGWVFKNYFGQLDPCFHCQDNLGIVMSGFIWFLVGVFRCKFSVYCVVMGADGVASLYPIFLCMLTGVFRCRLSVRLLSDEWPTRPQPAHRHPVPGEVWRYCLPSDSVLTHIPNTCLCLVFQGCDLLVLTMLANHLVLAVWDNHFFPILIHNHILAGRLAYQCFWILSQSTNKPLCTVYNLCL